MEELALAALFAVIVGAAVYVTIDRQLKRTGDQEWRRRWKRIDRGRRRRIARSVRRGEAVRDPRDAQLAIDLVDQTERQLATLQPRGRWLERLLVTVEVVLVLGALVAAIRAFDFVGALLLLAPIVFLLVLLVFAKRATSHGATRFARARRANEDLLSGLGYDREPPAPTELGEDLRQAR